MADGTTFVGFRRRSNRRAHCRGRRYEEGLLPLGQSGGRCRRCRPCPPRNSYEPCPVVTTRHPSDALRIVSPPTGRYAVTVRRREAARDTTLRRLGEAPQTSGPFDSGNGLCPLPSTAETTPVGVWVVGQEAGMFRGPQWLLAAHSEVLTCSQIGTQRTTSVRLAARRPVLSTGLETLLGKSLRGVRGLWGSYPMDEASRLLHRGDRQTTPRKGDRL